MQDQNARSHSITLITALRHRSALTAALANRDEVTLQPILRWLIKYIPDYRITRLTTDVALVVLDLYADQLGRSEEIDELFQRLVVRVREVVDTSQTAISVGGIVDCLASCAGSANALEA
jgi:U3 small nucleolar RNA-associated protein 15